jgi:hypothetical protein
MARNTKEIYAVVKRNNGKSFWTRIGVAFENVDSSWNLLIRAEPSSPKLTSQRKRRNAARGSRGTAAAPRSFHRRRRGGEKGHPEAPRRRSAIGGGLDRRAICFFSSTS